jgi:hypothetical protein
MVELMVRRPVMRVVVAKGRSGEKKKRDDSGETRKAGFFAYFGPDFLPLQAIKPASIYRRWKRVTSSTPG